MAKNDFAIGLLVGGALGALVALLYAPAPGEETRQTLSDRATDLGHTVKDRATDYGQTVKDKATVVGQTVKDKATQVGSTVRDKMAAMKHGEEPVTAQDVVVDAGGDVVDEAQASV